MKIIKKNICLIAILSGVVGLSACSQDDAPTPDGGTDNGNTIRFTTAIAGFTGSDATADPGTRATINDNGTNTPGAVSRVSVDALLQHGGETLLLTHNGTEVHLTIDGQNADSLLLQ